MYIILIGSSISYHIRISIPSTTIISKPITEIIVIIYTRYMRRYYSCIQKISINLLIKFFFDFFFFAIFSSIVFKLRKSCSVQMSKSFKYFFSLQRSKMIIVLSIYLVSYNISRSCCIIIVYFGLTKSRVIDIDRCWSISQLKFKFFVANKINVIYSDSCRRIACIYW